MSAWIGAPVLAELGEAGKALVEALVRRGAAALQRAGDRAVALAHAGVDVGDVALKAAQPRVGHERLELGHHLRALRAAVEHAERQRRGGQGDPDQREGDQRPASDPRRRTCERARSQFPAFPINLVPI